MYIMQIVTIWHTFWATSLSQLCCIWISQYHKDSMLTSSECSMSGRCGGAKSLRR